MTIETMTRSIPPNRDLPPAKPAPDPQPIPGGGKYFIPQCSKSSQAIQSLTRFPLRIARHGGLDGGNGRDSEPLQ
ncbi:hypothetical protein SPHINGO391_530085 [Sphingomonas aurantiaca]|uniref:Uncharacterized protein n=1 Tax=Sphingomonas aurantiaca TaxID=185949 RepID=A0A5E8AME3_9SPHN|nr:hypothetical protein SPHINGO391_530085 [Sphingomonas aurantiaca]